MSNLNHILQQVFRKETLEEVSVEQLEQLAEQYPLFAPAHFLLAKKYKVTGNELYKKQVQKTALHFHNPLWLYYQIAGEETRENGYDHRTVSPVVEPSVTEVPLPAIHDAIEEVVVHQEAAQLPEPMQSSAVSPEKDISEQAVDVPVNSTDDAHIGEIYSTTTAADALKMAGSEAVAGHKEEEASPEAHLFLKPGSTIVDTGDLDETTRPEKATRVQPHPLFGKQNDEDNGERKPAFEPFHTVDYFASQGIKVSQEIKPEDRLGKQMKSFTEWLKTMRKLPEASVEAELEKINDREIVSIAEHSLDENEVVTEAMAEVLFKQGRHEQAADVYRKLSLLNPAKSSYFAAKIEALKNH